MGHEHMQSVFEHSKLRGTAYYVLLVIAESINDRKGYGFWGEPKLAKRARLSERMLRRHIYTCVRSGELVVLPGKGKVHHYMLPALEGEFGYDPQPCAEPHLCNGMHTYTPDISGRTPDISGRTPDISGRTPDISGRTPDISGRYEPLEPIELYTTMEKPAHTHAYVYTREEVRDPQTGHVQPPGTKPRRFRDLLPRIPDPPQKETAQ